MIQIINKEDCSGCGACSQICPKSCIKMIEDEAGFLYPTVDSEACIECNLCVKICPLKQEIAQKTPITVKTARTKNDVVLLNSSSGGVFYELAKHVLEKGGVVYGAAFDRVWEVHHVQVEDHAQLPSIMRSKYVQSRTEETFVEVKHTLENGQMVLYVGTPCQIGGLKSFLRKEYDNLICVDFFCHGVSSPLLWRKYLKQRFVNRNREVQNVNFRSKRRSWFNFDMSIAFTENGEKRIYECQSEKDPFMMAFYNNYVRPSCLNCHFRDLHTFADLTIADAWWIVEKKSHPFNDDKGTSSLIVNTPKGEIVSRSLDIATSECSKDDFLGGQAAVREGVARPEHYDYFFEKLHNSKDVVSLIEYVTRKKGFKSFIKRIYHYGIKRFSGDF